MTADTIENENTEQKETATTIQKTTTEKLKNKNAKKQLDLFNKTIFKQTFRSNWKLWSIFTGVLCLFLVVSVLVYDPISMSKMMDMMKSMGSESLNNYTFDLSLNGTLASMFFGMLGVILPMIYILITANGLIASKVDRGSMAYTLSTPIKRKTVVATNGGYLISMLIAMFTIIAVVGLVTSQLVHGNVFGTPKTADAKALSKEGYTISQLYEMQTNPDLLTDPDLLEKYNNLIEVGATARRIDDFNIYKKYLELKVAGSTDSNIIESMTDEITEKITQGMQTAMEKAYIAAVDEYNINKTGNDRLTSLGLALGTGLDKLASYPTALNEAGKAFVNSLTELFEIKETVIIQNNGLTITIEIGSLLKTYYNWDTTEVPSNSLTEAGEKFQDQFVYTQLAGQHISLDEGLPFAVGKFLLMILGCFLFAFAIASISFFFSCMCNLSKNSIALGTGIPIGFYLLQTISQLDNSLDF